MTLEMTYSCAELIQLIVRRSDSELEVQRYSMKKNTFIVDPSYHVGKMNYEWNNVKNRPQTIKAGFLKTVPRKLSFRILIFEVGSVLFLENPYPTFSSGSAHPYYQ